MSDIVTLVQNEGWDLKKIDGIYTIDAFGQTFPFAHPVQIYLKLYRREENPESKYLFMKSAHDYLWPKDIPNWHYWTEDRFREHCNGWKYIGVAAGASASKSYDIAKIACLFWLANPKKRGVVVASTTLESLSARIWGYATKFISTMDVKLPFQYLGGNSPKIIYPTTKNKSEIRDTIHGMFAVAAKSGDAEKSISSWIGRHPDEAMMLILDEATDINANVVNSFTNLDTGGKPFQCYAIGNSNSVNDLHGAMCTPKIGWDKIDPLEDKKWETTRPGGICLFYSCYDSPAIHEKDAEKKKRLGKFLITEEIINHKRVTLGEKSDQFYRFVLGFWKSEGLENTILSKPFIDAFGVQQKTEWSGFYPLQIVGGLDPAFSEGGDECVLKLPVLGYNTDGLLILDFMEDKRTYKIPLIRTEGKAVEIQIANKVMEILQNERVRLRDVAVDATGQGRALGGVLELHQKNLSADSPIRIYSSQIGKKTEDAFDVIVVSGYDLWFNVRKFIASGQIKGLRNETIKQLTSRLVNYNKNRQPILESKREYKTRMAAINPLMAHSPDDADAVALAVHAATLNYGFTLGKKREMPRPEKFDDIKLYIHKQEQLKNKEIENVKKKMTPLRSNFLKGLETIKRKSF